MSGYGVTFEDISDSCVVRMGLDKGSAASLMLPATKWLDHIVQGSLLNDVNLLAKLKGVDESFIEGNILFPENKDASDTEDDDADDQDVDDGGDEDFTGGEGAGDDDDGDPKDDQDGNGNGVSNDEDDDDNGDEHEGDEEEKKEEEEVEEDRQPAKKRKWK
ncbi:hypothetical protein TEA_029882 [Camellia sinensis var. sinensis]|uniref:Uncharacterized protein n=1 Tax=Camellia sinensis var. sinensis TaxID=542762 RepID=A0A4S4EC12_CAMSN|nr:hypothetical protein TEA_029882 [Camellia sinensis var. sinensis]